MCPVSEMRERASLADGSLTHTLEKECADTAHMYADASKSEPGTRLYLKEFQRSAAGSDLSAPELVRPPVVLDYTMDFIQKVRVSPLPTCCSRRC
jgi:hypothetical protein